ncbi:MAG TPA: histidine--tRNA ligase [Actinomycetota bacterium]|nr:histidine--tRNA ligase [Actinomycetota bacterium]
MSKDFQAPKGTNDIVPPDSARWLALARSAEETFTAAGYDYVETPIFEHTEVFERGVGEASEVVGKQMYTFVDRGGRSLTLRPEGTAPVVRTALEHRLDRGALPVKLFYAGPFFRQERPQKGRYRQFSQIGIEAIGADDPLIDAEVIELAVRFLRGAGVQPTLLLNSIGHLDPSCRRGYLDVLVGWLRDHVDALAEDDRAKIDVNPLRIFDSKEQRTIDAMQDAPLITDHLCDACRKHFDEVQTLLRDVGVGFEVEPRLVRGLDYYTRTAFELVAGGLGSQNAVGGGGRYDGLSEALGGPPLASIGFALGMDRILLAAESTGERDGGVEVYVVAIGERATTEAFKVATDLRRAGIGAQFDVTRRAMKGQMKDADRSGAAWAVIIGDDELDAAQVTLKDLKGGEQQTVGRSDLVRTLEERRR